MSFRLTRRHMLASVTAGGAAFGTGFYGFAFAQSVKRIEQFAPELDKIIGIAEPINQLADGVGGDNGPAEGPLWWKEGGYLLFSDINGNRRMKYTPGQGTVEFKKPTNGANGLTRDIQGRLVACEGAGRRVIREEHDGTITVIASSFQGRRLNRPNDVVVKSDGAIYFSDPNTGNAVPDQTDLTYAGVYHVSPDLGTLTLLVNDFITPNGLAFSPDESVLYINDSRRRHIRASDMAPNGTLAR
jgi:gluconolactonase